MTARQDNGQDEDCEKEKESRPRRKRQLPPAEKKDAEASDDSIESPVEDSDDDANYKEESSQDESSEPSDDELSGLAAEKTQTVKKASAT